MPLPLEELHQSAVKAFRGMTRMGLSMNGINLWLADLPNIARYSRRVDPGSEFSESMQAAAAPITEDSRNRVLQAIEVGLAHDTAGIEKLIRKYKLQPCVQREENGQLSMFMETQQGATRFPEGEAYAVQGVVYLAVNNMLDALRSCEVCSSLYQPKKGERQKTCSTACSKKAYLMTDQERARRREYQKRRYREQVQGYNRVPGSQHKKVHAG